MNNVNNIVEIARAKNAGDRQPSAGTIDYEAVYGILLRGRLRRVEEDREELSETTVEPVGVLE